MDNAEQYVDRRLENIRLAFHALSTQIRTVLLTQAGDERRLSIARDEVLAFERAVNIVSSGVKMLQVCKRTFDFRMPMSFLIKSCASVGRAWQTW